MLNSDYLVVVTISVVTTKAPVVLFGKSVSCTGTNAGDESSSINSCCHFAEGANGDGMAIVSSLRSFDRERQKEYLIPIIIKDSGAPLMAGTSTLTVVIGDDNDNKMQPGSKDIFVYNYAVTIDYTLKLFPCRKVQKKY